MDKKTKKNPFDNKGYDEETLLKLCDNQNLSRSIVKLIYWPNEVYSFGRYIRKYAYYPSFFPLYCYTDHGAGYYVGEIAKHELENDAPCQFYHSPSAVERFKKSSNKPCYTMMSPFVICRRMNNIEKLENTQGTLAFPTHSTPEIDLTSDIENYIDELKKMPEEFKPISVCLHMHDINKGQHKLFMKHGFPVYTAGDVFDKRFAERFYNILKNFKYTTSNMIGSYTYYSVEMGIPFSIYGAQPLLTNNGDTNLEKGEYKFYEQEEYQKLYKLFEGLSKEITPVQKKFVETHLGIYDGLSRCEMAKILYKAYFKKGNLARDILYPFWKYLIEFPMKRTKKRILQLFNNT